MTSLVSPLGWLIISGSGSTCSGTEPKSSKLAPESSQNISRPGGLLLGIPIVFVPYHVWLSGTRKGIVEPPISEQGLGSCWRGLHRRWNAKHHGRLPERLYGYYDVPDHKPYFVFVCSCVNPYLCMLCLRRLASDGPKSEIFIS